MTAPSGEFAFIDWLRRLIPFDPRVCLGPGDDAAALRLTSGVPALVTTDMLMDGVDFHLAHIGPRVAGRKAMSVNLSDMAAVAGRPVAAFVAVALPRRDARSVAEEMFRGLREVADQFETAIAGGDTNTWSGPLVICVTLVGEATAKGPVRRGGALVGDWLLATGSFGGSIRGKHLEFTPRVREALRLHEMADLHAMIDVSDGLAADLWHLCAESHKGAVLHADAIPMAPAARHCNDGRSPLEHALGDGEDFELLFAVPGDEAARLLHEQPLGDVPLTRLGEFVERGVWLEQAGQLQELPARGYVHAFE